MYAKDISKKIKSVKRDKQRKGLFIGGKPVYGYTMHPTEKNKIVIDEGAAPVVRRVFAMALDGISCRQIAERLNAEGVPSPATYAGLPMPKTGPHAGLWRGERISDMLQNETYIGNMVQGRSVKVSYKSKKCLKQKREDWVVVEGTHQPIVDRETFETAKRLIGARTHTRSRTYDFLLKGLVFCHECGHPLAVINRKNAAGEDVLYFVCRTYQRFTKAGVCTSHTIKEETVTRAVVEKMREVCGAYLQAERLLPQARRAVAGAGADSGEEIRALDAKIDSLTARLDKIYMDQLRGVLDEGDFRRIYAKVKADRAVLTEQRKRAEIRRECRAGGEDRAEELIRRFAQRGWASRWLLFDLIERVELTAEKQIIIQFRFKQPGCGRLEPASAKQPLALPAALCIPH